MLLLLLLLPFSSGPDMLAMVSYPPRSWNESLGTVSHPSLDDKLPVGKTHDSYLVKEMKMEKTRSSSASEQRSPVSPVSPVSMVRRWPRWNGHVSGGGGVLLGHDVSNQDRVVIPATLTEANRVSQYPCSI